MTIRPPEDLTALVSGSPKSVKLAYDEEMFLKEIKEDSPDLDHAVEEMRQRVKALEKEREGVSPWPQVGVTR